MLLKDTEFKQELEDFIKKCNSKYWFKQSELEEYMEIFDVLNMIVDQVADEPRRWNRFVKYIIKVGKEYYSIGRDRALTECQENGDWGQPVKVEPYETIKIEWRELRNE